MDPQRRFVFEDPCSSKHPLQKESPQSRHSFVQSSHVAYWHSAQSAPQSAHMAAAWHVSQWSKQSAHPVFLQPKQSAVHAGHAKRSHSTHFLPQSSHTRSWPTEHRVSSPYRRSFPHWLQFARRSSTCRRGFPPAAEEPQREQ